AGTRRAVRLFAACSTACYVLTSVPASFSLLFFPSFFFNDTAPTEIYTLSLHDALPISSRASCRAANWSCCSARGTTPLRKRTIRSEEHTSELQSRFDLVCRLLLEKKKKNIKLIAATYGIIKTIQLVVSIAPH